MFGGGRGGERGYFADKDNNPKQTFPSGFQTTIWSSTTYNIYISKRTRSICQLANPRNPDKFLRAFVWPV